MAKGEVNQAEKSVFGMPVSRFPFLLSWPDHLDFARQFAWIHPERIASQLAAMDQVNWEGRAENGQLAGVRELQRANRADENFHRDSLLTS